MKRFYSQSTGCTYLSGLNVDMPSDAAPITEERFLAVIGNPEPGKVRAHDEGGLPILIDPPAATVEQLSAAARTWRDSKLSASQWVIDRHRDQAETGVSLSLSGSQYSELMVYRQALRDWPMAADFPQDQGRPSPPGWLAEVEGGA
ncbi:phage tail assembly chaperone [Pseudomonas parakoreensis]|jgi:hypothetical protein